MLHIGHQREELDIELEGIMRRVEGDFGRTARVHEGERNNTRDVRPETYGREETGVTEQYGSEVHRLGESL